jgi:flagellar assembly factor FliW
MTQPAPLPQTTPAPAAAPLSIDTRFGSLALDPGRLIEFPHGLVGFADQQRFALLDLPDSNLPFKLLQSIDEVDLAFLVLPIDPGDGPIAAVELFAAAEALGCAPAALAVLVIVTMRPGDDGTAFTANLRAPVLIDTERRQGSQYVLSRDDYQVRHQLPLTAGHAA